MGTCDCTTLSTGRDSLAWQLVADLAYALQITWVSRRAGSPFSDVSRYCLLSQLSTSHILASMTSRIPRGHRFGTILVDVQTHKVLDVLSDRTAGMSAKCQAVHPEIELVSRDPGRRLCCRWKACGSRSHANGGSFPSLKKSWRGFGGGSGTALHQISFITILYIGML